MARFCREQAHRLTPREFDFVSNIAMSPREPSEKQSDGSTAFSRD